MSRVRVLKALSLGAAAAGAGAGSLFWWTDRQQEKDFRRRLMPIASADMAELNKRPTTQLPTRQELLAHMQDTPEYDVLVIGGGATGAGVALDAQTRGLQTCLVELDDYSSGTSSRSTKLIHGGVRYLQSAIMKLDREQYKMVKEALFERANLLEIAPHLAYPLPIMLPVYKLWQVPYFYIGIKMYDLVAGKRLLKSSYVIGKRKALELFPMLNKDKLCGAIIYYDGQHDDARMCLDIILTAVRQGAHCANHVEATALLKNEEGKVCGARLRDVLSGKEWEVKAKSVVNATGPFSDSIRIMDEPTKKEICVPSQGVHIVLPGYYSPTGCGLLDPDTSDGRVIFFLPWERMTVAGTTDSPTETTHSPAPCEKDIEFILHEIQNYLSKDVNVRRGDVMSAWAGLRPLVRDPNKKDTASLARNHIIEVSDSHLVTIAGGKWTTYRQMAQETVDTAVNVCGLKPKNPCVTPGLLLEGAHEYSPLLYIRLVQDYGMEVDVAQHLAHMYGDRAYSVAKMAKLTGKRWPIVGTRLHQEFPQLEAEVHYAVREYACTAVDVLGRRLRLAFLNTYAAQEALPTVIDLMAQELGWNKTEKQKQYDVCKEFLDSEMGQKARQSSLIDAPLHLTKEEKLNAESKFKLLDADHKGHITLNDLRRYFRNKGEKIDERLLHELLNEVDLNKNGEISLMEFLQLYSGLKGGHIAHSRLARYLDQEDIGVRRSSIDTAGGL